MRSRRGQKLLLPISGTRNRPASAGRNDPREACGSTSRSLPTFCRGFRRSAEELSRTYRTRAVAAPPACMPASPALSIVSSE